MYFVVACAVLAAPTPAAADASPQDVLRAARMLWRYEMYAQAIPLLEQLADDHRDTDLGEYSVELLLDSLIRTRRFDTLVARVDGLLADGAFLADKPDLAERLRVIQGQARRKEAEHAERARDYERCAELYAGIFAADPNAQHADEVLYNAGICARRAGDVGQAIVRRTMLIERYPTSHIAARTWAWLADDYATIADYRRAAERLEGYAKRYAGEEDAPAALTNAIAYRRGLGDVAAAADDVAWFVKVFGAKRRDDAAAALFGLAGMYRDDAKRAAALRRYVKTFGARGDRDRLIIATAELGRIAWAASCRAADNGLCRSKRAGKRAKAARAQLQKAVDLERRWIGGSRDELPAHRAQAVRDAVGAAKVALADAELETALRDATAEVDAVAQAYADVVEVGSARWSVAALARRGQLLEARGDTAAATEQYVACLAAASDAAIDGPFAALCDGRVAAALPAAASPAERRAAPTAQPELLSRPALATAR